jgi:hypothetical protein
MRKPLCSALVVALLATVAAAEPFDTQLPDSTFVYVSIENIARSKERFQGSPLEKLWKDEAMQAFLKKPLEKWDEEMKSIKEEAGVNIGDLLALVNGQIVFAIPKIEMDKNGELAEPEPVVLFDIGENAAKVKEMIGTVEEGRFKEMGMRRLEEEFGGVTIVRYVNPNVEITDKDGNTRPGDGPVAWYVDGSTFAVSPKADDLKFILRAKADTEAPKLASDEAYRRMRARLGENPEFFAYVGMKQRDKALAEVQDMEAQVIRMAMGLDQMEAIGLQSTLGRGGLTTNMFVSVPGEKSGMLRIFDAKNSPLNAPKWVPADATDVSTMILDLNSLLKEAKAIAAKMGQPGAIEQTFEMVKGFGIDLENDFFAALGKEMTFFQKAGGGQPANPAMGMMAGMGLGNFAMAIEIKDKAKMEGTLDKLGMLLQQWGFMVESEDYLEVKIRKINVMGMFEVAMVLLPDQFLFSMGTEMLKDVIRNYGKDVKGLADSEDYRRGMALVPEARTMMSFSQIAKSFQGSIFGMLTTAQSDVFEADKFPKPEVFEKYLDVAATAVVNEEGGIFYTYVVAFKESGSDD